MNKTKNHVSRNIIVQVLPQIRRVSVDDLRVCHAPADVESDDDVPPPSTHLPADASSREKRILKSFDFNRKARLVRKVMRG